MSEYFIGINGPKKLRAVGLLRLLPTCIHTGSFRATEDSMIGPKYFIPVQRSVP
jgi:hypothetical protein